MNKVDFRAERTAVAYPSRSRASERPNLTLVDGGKRRRQTRTIPLMRRFLTTLAALVLLIVVLKFLPPMSKHSDLQASRGTVPAAVSDLHLSGVQISGTVPAAVSDLHLSGVQINRAPDGTALYFDGIVTNAGNSRVTGATADVGFRDAQGRLVATLQKPLVGMSHGGTDLVRNEFAKNPIMPKEMRFFRIAVEDVPPAWNHELPQLIIVDIKAR